MGEEERGAGFGVGTGKDKEGRERRGGKREREGKV